MSSKKTAAKESVTFAGKKKINSYWKKAMKNKEAQAGYTEAEALYEYIEALKKEMKKKHLTYYAVAKKAGVKHQVLARLLSGADNAETATLSKVATGVGK